jgi:hypothetical protein
MTYQQVAQRVLHPSGTRRNSHARRCVVQQLCRCQIWKLADSDGYGFRIRERGLSAQPCLTPGQRRNRVRLALLPPDRYPHVVEAAVPLTVCDDPDLHYRFGVDLFIAGVQAVAGGAGGRRHRGGPA